MTELKNLLEAKNRDELRQWLKKNHATELECWVTVKRGRPKEDETFWYVDAVEEALCFGWIDSTTKKLSDNCTIQRLTPRQKNSAWSELNKERCRRMERMGRMTDAGRDCCPDMSGAGFVIDTEILAALKSDPEVWANFQSFPPLYRRVRIDTIQINRAGCAVQNFSKSDLINLLRIPAKALCTVNGMTTDGYYNPPVCYFGKRTVMHCTCILI